MVYWQKLHRREEPLQSMRESAECMKGNGEIIRKQILIGTELCMWTGGGHFKQYSV
jgi:hypothetical protein